MPGMADQEFANDDWEALRTSMKAYLKLKTQAAPLIRSKGQKSKATATKSHEQQLAEARDRVKKSLFDVQNSAFTQKERPTWGTLPPAAIGPARRLIEHLRKVRDDGGYHSEPDRLEGKKLVDRFSKSVAAPRATKEKKIPVAEEVTEKRDQDSDGDYVPVQPAQVSERIDAMTKKPK